MVLRLPQFLHVRGGLRLDLALVVYIVPHERHFVLTLYFVMVSGLYL